LIRSMTAYGRGEYQQGDTLFIAEVRSVNNRYRDIILRIPKNFQTLEKDLRSIILGRIRRGRIEASIQVDENGEQNPCNLELNMPLVDSYLKVFDQLAERFGLDREVHLETLCQMKDVIIAKPESVDLDRVKPGFLGVLQQALDSLDVMRIREGEAIAVDFAKRLDLLEGYVNEVGKRAPDVVEEYRKRLKESINSLLEDASVDEGRLTQEVAIFADRSDITEEVVRIRSHLKQFREYLSVDEALGRRLDFLIQEINREVNTLGAKASDSMISGFTVEMKAELEKLREQVQNIE